MSADDEQAPAGLVVRAAVTDVLHAYCYRLDAGDIDGLVALFTADCAVDYGPEPESQVGSRAQYRAWLQARIGRFACTSHQLSNIRITADRSGARADSYVHAWHRPADGGAVAMLWGRYHDRLVAHHGHYLIARRRLEVVGQEGLGGVWHAVAPRIGP